MKHRPTLHALCGLLLIGMSATPWITAGADPGYQILQRLDEAPGNITVTVDGRIIMSLHQFYDPKRSVVELTEGGTLVPFPNEALNTRTNGAGIHLDSVLGIRSDDRAIVWMLDNGMRSHTVPKLVAWDTRQDKLVRVIELPPPLAPHDAFVNDFAIDTKRNAIYIADPAGGSNAALIVINLDSDQRRRVLQGHPSVVPEPEDLVIDDQPVQIKTDDGRLIRPHIGINPITLDLANEWVYYGPMHGRSLYRVRAKDLMNDTLPPALLSGRVERYSDKPISDGITIDEDNNIYLGDLAANAIGVVTADRKYRLIARSKDLSWVDSLCFGPQGRLYAVVNRLHQSSVLNAGVALSRPPYFVLSVNALAPGLPGR